MCSFISIFKNHVIEELLLNDPSQTFRCFLSSHVIVSNGCDCEDMIRRVSTTQWSSLIPTLANGRSRVEVSDDEVSRVESIIDYYYRSVCCGRRLVRPCMIFAYSCWCVQMAWNPKLVKRVCAKYGRSRDDHWATKKKVKRMPVFVLSKVILLLH